MPGDQEKARVAARGVERGRDGTAIVGPSEAERLEVDGMNGSGARTSSIVDQSRRERLLPPYHGSVNDARAT